MDWERKITSCETKIRARMDNAAITFFPDSPAAYEAPGVYHAPHAEFAAGAEGTVETSSFDPWFDVRERDLNHVPKITESVIVSVKQDDGTWSTPMRFKIRDTNENGFRSIKVMLSKVTT